MEPVYRLIVSTLISVITAALGVYLYRLEPESTPNRLVLLICIWFVEITMSAQLVFINWMGKDGIVFLFTVTSFFIHTLFALNLHFYLYLKEKKGLSVWKLVCIYLPSLLLMFVPIINYKNYIDIALINGYWRAVPSLHSIWLYIFVGLTLLYSVITLFIIYQYGKRSQSNREKKQAAVLFASFFLSCAGNQAVNKLADSFPQTPSLFVYPMAIYILGLYYAVFKYRFPDATPSLATEDIISNISDMVMLLNTQQRIVMANGTTDALLSARPETLKGLNFF